MVLLTFYCLKRKDNRFPGLVEAAHAASASWEIIRLRGVSKSSLRPTARDADRTRWAFEELGLGARGPGVAQHLGRAFGRWRGPVARHAPGVFQSQA
jgi:hypothetical protein